MKCTRIHRLLPGYLAGELKRQNRQAVAFHISSCPACTAELEELKADAELMAAVDAPELSQFVVTRVMAEVRADGTQPELRRRLVLGRAIAAAAAVVLVTLGAWAGTVLGSGLAGSGSGRDDFQQMLAADSEETLDDYFSSMLGEER